MSVVITVGWLDEMRRFNEEGFADYRAFFQDVSAMLAKRNLAFVEPENLGGRGWGWQVFPPNGIAYLQRLAVYLWQKEEWPAPGTEDMGNPLEDEEIDLELEDCYIEETEPNSKGQRFNHLVCHPCREGFWLPVDFDEIIFEEIQGGREQFGSSIRLEREVMEIVRLLELPLDLDPRKREVEDRTRFASRDSEVPWQRYGIEAYSCLLLYHAARASRELGAAIHLH
jgi:hypothetical protein